MDVVYHRSSATLPTCFKLLRYILQGLVAVITYILDGCRSLLQVLIPREGAVLRGNVVLITGAGEGIGRELALQFARHDCVVACIDADPTSTERTIQLVNQRCGCCPGSQTLTKRAFGYTCDVTEQRDAMKMVRKVQRDLGRIDILVNNASKITQPISHSNPEEMVDITTKNIMEQFWVMSAVLPEMMKRQQGHVVIISPRTGVSDVTREHPHSSTQSAVTGLLDTFNAEFSLEDNNIHLTYVHLYSLNNTKPSIPHNSHWRFFELSEEFAASEIIRGVRHRLKSFTIPRNVLFWFNVFRTLPQDPRHAWQDIVSTHQSSWPARERVTE